MLAMDHSSSKKESHPQKRGRSMPGPSALTAITLLVACSVLGLARPFIPWDSWWYHLPFSSRLWNIGGGAESFHLSPLITGRWLGFPKAWEWIQGLFWAVTGTLYSIIVPQLLLFAAYLAYVSRVHRIPLNWVIFGFFASPLLFIHFQATYLDLPAGICLALGFLLSFDLLEDVRTTGRRFPSLKVAGCILSLGLAGNIKYQSLLAALLICGIVGVVYVFAKGIPVRTRAKLLVVLLIATLVASASALKNGIVYGNPVYPLFITVHGNPISTGLEESEADSWDPTYRFIGDRMISLPRPINFLLSATELDWTMRGIPQWYSIDSGVGIRLPQRGTGGSRTGGWGGVFFILNALLLALQCLRLRQEPDRTQRLLVVSTLVLLVATSAFPRSHELRYWLYIPLVLIAINLRYLRMHSDRSAVVSGALGVLMAYGVVHTVMSPESGLFLARRVTVRQLRAQIPAPVVREIQTTGRYCFPMDVSSLLPQGADVDSSPFYERSKIDSELFRYSAAVTGLPGLTSGVAADCRDATR
jgi:hypothetical protein